MINPKFQFKFQFRAEGRDETEFPIGHIVDQTEFNLFKDELYRNIIKISPDGCWCLLFQYEPNFIVVLNLGTGHSYKLAPYSDTNINWQTACSIKWVHSGINNIRESSSFGCSAQRFSVNCEHVAGEEWQHPIIFVREEDFNAFSSAKDDLLAPGRDRSIWFDGTFRAIDAGSKLIQSNKPWTYFELLGKTHVQIVAREQTTTHICRYADIEKYFRKT